jgi:hypothetical protein
VRKKRRPAPFEMTVGGVEALACSSGGEPTIDIPGRGAHSLVRIWAGLRRGSEGKEFYTEVAETQRAQRRGHDVLCPYKG